MKGNGRHKGIKFSRNLQVDGSDTNLSVDAQNIRIITRNKKK